MMSPTKKTKLKIVFHCKLGTLTESFEGLNSFSAIDWQVMKLQRLGQYGQIIPFSVTRSAGSKRVKKIVIQKKFWSNMLDGAPQPWQMSTTI